ncbi:hypothetical protein P5673_031222 [Acropora cervicornis]|uniref:Uncharacterized protein n=1 Tax=Acropora cervicornis TaxID=6130 RepID=A0AAD9USZ1_ACRCE|nr:hypothetical protein P5673_031222 [Acropora cervicornis]
MAAENPQEASGFKVAQILQFVKVKDVQISGDVRGFTRRKGNGCNGVKLRFVDSTQHHGTHIRRSSLPTDLLAKLDTGDTSTQVSSKRREQVLTKLNPVLASLGKDDFPDSGKQLFGDGFESCLKLRSETANTVADAKKPGSTGAFGVAEVVVSKPPKLKLTTKEKQCNTFEPHQAADSKTRDRTVFSPSSTTWTH